MTTINRLNGTHETTSNDRDSLMEERQRLGRRIRALRERKGLSQGDLAKLSRIDQSSLSQIEAGKRYAGSLIRERIAVGLGIAATDLEAGAGAGIEIDAGVNPEPEFVAIPVISTCERPAVPSSASRLARELEAASKVAAALEGLDDAGIQRVLAFVGEHFRPAP